MFYNFVITFHAGIITILAMFLSTFSLQREILILLAETQFFKIP